MNNVAVARSTRDGIRTFVRHELGVVSRLELFLRKFFLLLITHKFLLRKRSTVGHLPYRMPQGILEQSTLSL